MESPMNLLPVRTHAGLLCAGLAAVLLAWTAPADAAIVTASTPNCGAYVVGPPDSFSPCDDTAFVQAAGAAGLAIGAPIDFSRDKDGNPFSTATYASATAISGDVFSDKVRFHTRTLGGLVGSVLLVTGAPGDPGSFEIAPIPADGNPVFTGTLVVEFLVPVRAAGFGTVAFSDSASVDVYGPGGLLMTLGAVSDADFDHLGLLATGGDLISRVEFTDIFFAIQNVSFSVPAPSGLAALGLGAALLGLRLRRRQARPGSSA